MTTRRRLLAALSAALATTGCSELYGAPDEGDTGGTPGTPQGTGMAVQGATDGPIEEVLLSIVGAEGDGEWLLVGYEHVAEVADVGGSGDHHWASVALTDAGWASMHDGFSEANAFTNPDQRRMRTHVGGEVVFEAEIPGELASAVEEGEWAGTIRASTRTSEQAEAIAEAIRGG